MLCQLAMDPRLLFFYIFKIYGYILYVSTNICLKSAKQRRFCTDRVTNRLN